MGYQMDLSGINKDKLVFMKSACFFLSVVLITLLFSCQNSSDQFEKLDRTLGDSSSFTGFSGNSVKLVKTADMNVKVKNVEQTTRSISALAQQHGGMVYYQNFKSVNGGSRELKVSDDSLMVVSTVTPQANITVRVPSHNLERFIIDASELGYFTGSSQLQIDDKSLVYIENALKQKNRETVLYNPAKQRKDSLGNVQSIQIGDEAIQKFIANKTIDADAAYSTVTLSLYQNAIVRKEMIANYFIDDYNLPFTARLSNALISGWDSFLNFLIALSHLWMFILFALFVYCGYRLWQQRKRIIV